MTTFEEEFPRLKGKRKDILGDRTGQEWSGFYIDEDDVKAHCLDKQRVREEICGAVLSVNFDGYDKNSERALIEMEKILFERLNL